MYTIYTAAQEIGVSTTTIRRWAADMCLDGQRERKPNGEYGMQYLSDRDFEIMKQRKLTAKQRQPRAK